MREPATLLRQCVSEMTGTFVLVFFGVGSVHAASVLYGPFSSVLDQFESAHRTISDSRPQGLIP